MLKLQLGHDPFSQRLAVFELRTYRGGRQTGRPLAGRQPGWEFSKGSSNAYGFASAFGGSLLATTNGSIANCSTVNIGLDSNVAGHGACC